MLKHSLVLLTLAYSSLSIAGGPLVLQGPSGTTPVTYQNPNITVNIENGDLGSLSNAAADTLVLDAFTLWNGVSTSTINLIIDQAQINLDINISNFDEYLPNTNFTLFNDGDGLNPIVYDDNGEIIDAFFGLGQSDTTIGFAASVFDFRASYFNEGYAVINGKITLSNTELKLLIAHEIGHLFGLDHTQVDINNKETDFGLPLFCSTSVQSAYPLMYPFICRDEESLHQDDISAVSALYPVADIDNSFGILQGQFVDANGWPILGANIWAKNTATGETVSIVSDYLHQRNGFYKLYLPAGNYTLHANSLNALFHGASSVGPYARTVDDISFIAPHPITELLYQGDSTGSVEVITIANNQSLTINFGIDGNAAVVASNNDDDDSFADLFGATSHLTLLVLLSLLIGHRFTLKNQRKN